MSKELFYEYCEEKVADLLNEVEEGNISSLALYGNFKRVKTLIEAGIKQIENNALEESEIYSEKTFYQDGFTFEKKNGATRYSFSHIPEIIDLKESIKEIESKSKQAYLSMQKNILVADENGEDIPLPKVSYSKDTLIVKNK